MHLGYILLLLLTSSFQPLVFGVDQRANRGRAGHYQENWNRRHVQGFRFYFHLDFGETICFQVAPENYQQLLILHVHIGGKDLFCSCKVVEIFFIDTFWAPLF